MANSIRTPKQGATEMSRRIARAVDDEDWQKFRVSLKGLSTQDKLERLRSYWDTQLHSSTKDCDVCIRIDNYIKALCRGGQLFGGESLQTVLSVDWNVRIKR